MYVLRLILHDWNDADSAAILTNIRRAMGNAKAKLVIAECAASHPNQASRCLAQILNAVQARPHELGTSACPCQADG